MTFYGDFDPQKPPEEIREGSLWLDEKRGDGGGQGDYHGNFIPEIPYQLMRRFTRPGDVVLDPFAGGGTTIDVGQRLDRVVIASDLLPQREEVLEADAATLELDGFVDLIILHPPYWNIVEYTDYREDLSNTQCPEDFYRLFRRVVANVGRFLPPGKFLALVMGDAYRNKEVVPLAHECARQIRSLGYRMKMTVVKNVGFTQGKDMGKGRGLWRYRALMGNFCVFDHEYVMAFEKI